MTALGLSPRLVRLRKPTHSVLSLFPSAGGGQALQFRAGWGCLNNQTPFMQVRRRFTALHLQVMVIISCCIWVFGSRAFWKPEGQTQGRLK